jgi:hypothetical protein
MEESVVIRETKRASWGEIGFGLGLVILLNCKTLRVAGSLQGCNGRRKIFIATR